VTENTENQAEEVAEFEPVERLQVRKCRLDDCLEKQQSQSIATQDFGINAADIKKCRDSGIHTVGQVLMAPSKVLLDIKGFSEAKVEKVREAAAKMQGDGRKFKSGSDTLAARANIIKITTGSKELDAVIGGGVETSALTEIFGEFRTGKTQLCHTLAVTSQLGRDMGGGAGKVVVIDTEGSFRVERVAEIAEKRFGLDPAAVLDNISYARVHNHETQMSIVEHVAALIADDDEPTRLVILDSIMALFRVDFSGRGELADRQQKLNRHLADLKKLAEEFNVAILIVNQVTADPGGGVFVGAETRKPVGGHVLAHASTTRLYFRKGKGDQRICKVYDSPHMPEADATFAISEMGIVDAE